MSKNKMVNFLSDGNVIVKVFCSEKKKFFYTLIVGYKLSSSSKWVNQHIIISEFDLPRVLKLLKLVALSPEHSYEKYV